MTCEVLYGCGHAVWEPLGCKTPDEVKAWRTNGLLFECPDCHQREDGAEPHRPDSELGTRNSKSLCGTVAERVIGPR